MTGGDRLADLVGAQLATGDLGYVRHATIVPPPALAADDEDGLDPWMTRTARPTAPTPAAPNFEAMTVAELRGLVMGMHHRLTLVTMERDAAVRRIAELEALAAGPRTNTTEGV